MPPVSGLLGDRPACPEVPSLDQCIDCRALAVGKAALRVVGRDSEGRRRLAENCDVLRSQVRIGAGARLGEADVADAYVRELADRIWMHP